MINEKTHKTMFAKVIPKCATPSEFYLWKEAARKIKPVAHIGFCEDCTPQFKAAKIKDFKCENPLIMFVEDEAGNLDGRLPKQPRWK